MLCTLAHCECPLNGHTCLAWQYSIYNIRQRPPVPSTENEDRSTVPAALVQVCVRNPSNDLTANRTVNCNRVDMGAYVHVQKTLLTLNILYALPIPPTLPVPFTYQHSSVAQARKQGHGDCQRVTSSCTFGSSKSVCQKRDYYKKEVQSPKYWRLLQKTF